MNVKPDVLNICGIPYKIRYCQHESDVDSERDKPFLGYINYKTQTINVYDKNCNIEFIWNTIMHEVLHGIAESVCAKAFNDNEAELEPIARGLTDFLFRNDLIKLENREKNVNIIVNGIQHEVQNDDISYTQVVTIAFPDYIKNPERFFSVTYRRGQGNKPEGILSPDGKVKVKEGTTFSVSDTSNS